MGYSFLYVIDADLADIMMLTYYYRRVCSQLPSQAFSSGPTKVSSPTHKPSRRSISQTFTRFLLLPMSRKRSSPSRRHLIHQRSNRPCLPSGSTRSGS